ncbi:YeeE/YedE family protein, partial [Pseudomonas putida]|nr:YeeE/YedE family protein [Pseudomonas putida]
MGLSATATPEPRRLGAPLIALALLLAGACFLNLNAGLKQMLLLMVGAALGLTLYHAAFGFTSAWRVFINERRGAGLRAQMVMLTLAVL